MSHLAAVPDDLVLVGHVTGAFGIAGWIRIRPYSPEADALLSAKTWWFDKPEMHDVERLQVKTQGEDIVARIMGVGDRNAAEALKGSTVKISRKHFPPLGDDEYYWVDLIGFQVRNLEGVVLGSVHDMMDNGAHPILRVMPEASLGEELDSAEQEVADKKVDVARVEKLIPFVGQFIKNVDKSARLIEVDWGVDY